MDLRKQFREIRVEDGLPEDSSFPSNSVHSSSLTLRSLAITALRENLAATSTLWFAVFAVGLLDPIGLGAERSVAPVVLLLVCWGGKLSREVWALYQQRISDLELNKNPTILWTGAQFKSVPSHEVCVGQCLLIGDKSRLPADVLLLATSADDGTCYVSTANILGENDLEVKRAVRETQRFIPCENSPQSFNFQRLNAVLKVDLPSEDYCAFGGKMTIKTLPRASILDINNLILRGSLLQNTKWVLCMVVYTGMETKVWLRSLSASHKVSRFSQTLSLWTCAGIALVFLVSTVMFVCQFLASSSEPVTGQDFLLYVLSLGTEVPIAAFIALDIAKAVLLQRYARLHKDTVFKSGAVPEDLGQVSFVLIDKTGTLTENDLSVVQVIVEDDVFSRKEEVSKGGLESTHRGETRRWSMSTRERSENTFFDLREKMRFGHDVNFRRLCECMTLCNSVIPVSRDNFKSPSVDEKALVEAAKELGCSFVTRLDEECGVEMFDMCLTYRILAIRKFSPELKRVRVLVQGEFDEGATLYVVGAYSVLKDLLKMSFEDRVKLEQRIDDLTHSGLRTLVLSYRRLDGELFQQTKARAQNARLARLNVEGKIELLLKDLEKEITLLGVVGLSDMVINRTKECVDVMRRAGIETVVVSGDTDSNTLACAYSLGLMHADMGVVKVKGITSAEHCVKSLLEVAKEHCFVKQPLEFLTPETPKSCVQVLPEWEELRTESVDFALCIDGTTLSSALKSRSGRRLLVSLMYSSSFTCFCSMLPRHKRDLTRLLKKGLSEKQVVLAVGDDGSNVPMIVEASVGVGVSSTKDMHAAHTSDVSIPHFACLSRLLVDAKEHSLLLARLVLLFVHSVTVLHLIQLAYFAVADVTPCSLFSMDLRLLHSAVFTLLPAVTFAGTSYLHTEDRIPSSYHSEVSPGLTKSGLCAYVSLALIHFLCLAALIPPSFSVSGATLVSVSEVEITMMTAVVLVVNQHCCQEAAQWTQCVSALLSVASLLCYYAVVDTGLFVALWTTPRLVLSVGLATSACALVSFLFTRIEIDRRLSLSKVSPFISQSSFIRRIRNESRSMMDAYQSSNLLLVTEVADTAAFDMHANQVRFKLKSTEREYIQHFTVGNLRVLRFVAGFGFVQLLIAVFSTQNKSELPFVILACVGCFVLLLSTWLSLSFLRIIRLFTVIFTMLTFVFDVTTQSVRGLAYLSVPISLLLLAREQWIFNVFIVLFSFTLLVVDTAVQCIWFSSTSEDVQRTIGTVLIHGAVSLLASTVAYRSNTQSRCEFQLLKETEMRMAQNETILSFLLPDFVRRQVKDGLRYIAEDKGTVTVLFCEICDFDRICSVYSPSDLTELLDDVFQKIDELCATLGVAKIETVGKVYMACAGLSDHEEDMETDVLAVHHSMRAIELAAEILTAFKMYRLQTGEGIKFKIGVHTGPVIAGVVGHHKPQFSLVGDTVNTASRMSTTIDTPNTIQISDATYSRLKVDKYRFEFQQRKIAVKGKGEQTTYILKERENSLVKRTIRSGSVSEDPGSATAQRNKPARRRSSLVESLRDSLASQEAITQNDMEAVEKVTVLPIPHSESSSEAKFRRDFQSRKLPDLKLALSLHCFTQAALMVACAVDVGKRERYIVVLPGAVYTLGLMLGGYVRVRLAGLYQAGWIQWFLVGLYTVFGLGLCFSMAFHIQIDLEVLILCSQIVLSHHCSGLFFRHVLTTSATTVIPWVVVALFEEHWWYAAFAVIFAGQHCAFSYFYEKSQRTSFALSDFATNEVLKTEQLLTQMLPVQAYEGLKQEEWVTDKLLGVTLLYADISGFTAWSASRTPQEVVTHLSLIYTAFDKVCARLGVYKVHTIGDCYVAMSATNNSESRDPGEECRRMVTLALEMMTVLQSLEDNGLRMRAGLHTGDVVGSITGSKIVRYDIYGSDVLIANKMESSGAAGRVNVSEDVKAILERTAPTSFQFDPNTTVFIPEVDRHVATYFVSLRL